MPRATPGFRSQFEFGLQVPLCRTAAAPRTHFVRDRGPQIGPGRVEYRFAAARKPAEDLGHCVLGDRRRTRHQEGEAHQSVIVLPEQLIEVGPTAAASPIT